MGQAWCKEKSSKAQDSKSPLDRVFVRCAHRIYPGLKEDGSVLGGATQRVTSSEIGYAGSPPREILTRGRSIDSVDRPFHPSDWVDVNLEVPSTPRASSVLTNLTADTSLYPATTPTSSCSNLKDVTPVPPPRRRKRNRGRPLPPKPDDVSENVSNSFQRVDIGDEPLYSSVKPPKSINDEHADTDEETSTGTGTSKQTPGFEATKYEGNRAKEIYEHKVNGTGRVIFSDVVSGRRPSSDERRNSKTSDGAHHTKVHEDKEYERFARSRSIENSSTPRLRDGPRSKELEKRVAEFSRDNDKAEPNARPKNYSTVSLPNYDELDAARRLTERTKDDNADESVKSRRPDRSSTGSLPAESFLSPFSKKTSVRLEDYVPRRDSSGILSPYQVLRKLGCSENGVGVGEFVKYDPSKLEDWDLGDVSNCELNHRQRSFESSPIPDIVCENFAGRRLDDGEDVVDSSQNAKTVEDKPVAGEIPILDERRISRGSTPIQKPEAFGRSSTPVIDSERDSQSRNPNDWIVNQNKVLQYYDPPTMSESCKASPVCNSAASPVHTEPFFLNEETHRAYLDTIGGSCRNGAIPESERSGQSRAIFARSLSNESEPNDDPYESKELRVHSGTVTGELVRTISEESLPREMLEEVDRVDGVERDDFFGEKLTKDAQNKMKKDSADSPLVANTPPPSPEPKIRAEILENDHSTLLKVLKEEAAEESNLSSMTPSLTELEAALSDMLEKEDARDEPSKGDRNDDGDTKKTVSACTAEKPIEPSIVPVPSEKSSFRNESDDVTRKNLVGETHLAGDKILVDEDFAKTDSDIPVSLGQILGNAKPVAKVRKVSFCAWEERFTDSGMVDVDLRNDRNAIDQSTEFDGRTSADSGIGKVVGEIDEFAEISSRSVIAGGVARTDDAPEKPSRLHKFNSEEQIANVENIPMPPRRRHRSSSSVQQKNGRGSACHESNKPDLHADRLI